MMPILNFVLSTALHAQAWFNTGTPRQVYVKHKAAHALVGIGVAVIAQEFNHPRLGLMLVLMLGVGKELYDQAHGGAFRLGDVAWTFGPATFVVVMRW